MNKLLPFIGLIFTLTQGFAYAGGGDRFVGYWVNVRNSSDRMSITKNGDTYLFESHDRKDPKDLPAVYKDGILTVYGGVGTGVCSYDTKRAQLVVAHLGFSDRYVRVSREFFFHGSPNGKIVTYLIKRRAGVMSLKPVERKLTSLQAGDPVFSAVSLLCMGSSAAEGFKNPLPLNTKLLGVTVKDGLATVNFSHELERNFPGGSTEEELAISAIVKTLCQFPKVNRVQILIDGKVTDSIGGHVNIRKPLREK